MIDLLITTVGLLGLWIGSELVIRGSVAIADSIGLSQIFVGITILAIGSDLPELVISINASVQAAFFNQETSGIIIGNAIGSCFSQLSLILGIAGLAGYLTLSKSHLFKEGIMLIGSVLILILFGMDGQISRTEGIVLVVVYLTYFLTLFKQEKVKKNISKRK